MLIIINGASGAGKTFLLKHLYKIHGGCFVPIKKYTTRHRRTYEEEPSVDLVFSCEETFVDSFDLHYEHNNAKYGIDSVELSRIIQDGSIPVIIIRSFDTIRDIKRCFNDVKVIFIYGAAGDELQSRLIKQGRHAPQVESAVKGAQVIMEDLKKNLDVVDNYLYNQYDEEQYLSQFQSLVVKEVPR